MLRVNNNQLIYKDKFYQCAIGKGGFIAAEDKQEGDLKTPLGEFPLREVFYRADKISPENDKFRTKLPIREITENMGWCDEPEDENYNRLVELPYEASHEQLFREDDIYDIIVVLGYNDSPPIAGKGSAIFMHIAKPDYEGTEGCIALAKDDLLELLAKVEEGEMISITP